MTNSPARQIEKRHAANQTTRRVDIGDFIRRHPHPQYNKYLDPRHFRRFEMAQR